MAQRISFVCGISNRSSFNIIEIIGLCLLEILSCNKFLFEKHFLSFILWFINRYLLINERQCLPLIQVTVHDTKASIARTVDALYKIGFLLKHRNLPIQ